MLAACGQDPSTRDVALDCAAAAVPSSYVVVKAPETPAPARRTFYLDRDGAELVAGDDDAAAGRSSVVRARGRARVSIPAAALDDQAWQQTVACVRRQLEHHAVDVTDKRPAEPGYLAVVFGGSGELLGLTADVAGTAPIDSRSCRSIESAVVFVFTEALHGDAARACQVAAHEIAHAFSVDHSFFAADAMSYLNFGAEKMYQPVAAPCGELVPRACICGRASQSSVAILDERLGRAGPADDVPPVVDLSSGPGRRDSLNVRVLADDAQGVAHVSLRYEDAGGRLESVCGDGRVACTASGGAYTFNIPGARGTARFSATAVDRLGNTTVTPESSAALEDPGAPPELEIAASVVALPAESQVAAHVTSRAELVSAEAVWTDARGQTQRWPMCRDERGDYWLRVAMASDAGDRSLVVEATSAAGARVTSDAEVVSWSGR